MKTIWRLANIQFLLSLFENKISYKKGIMRSKIVTVTLLGIKAYLGVLMLPFMLVNLVARR